MNRNFHKYHMAKKEYRKQVKTERQGLLVQDECAHQGRCCSYRKPWHNRNAHQKSICRQLHENQSQSSRKWNISHMAKMN